MSSGLPRKSQDRVNNYGVVLIGLVSAVLLWVSVVALQAYYNRTAGDLEGTRSAEGKSRQVRDLKAQQLAELQDSKYVNPQKGIVTIPIDEAKALVLRDQRNMADSLVPAIGPHNLPTVPAVWGKPVPAAAGGAAAAAGQSALPPGSTPGTTPTLQDPRRSGGAARPVPAPGATRPSRPARAQAPPPASTPPAKQP